MLLRATLILIALALPSAARADRWVSDLPSEVWVSTHTEAVLRAAPGLEAERLAVVRPGTAMQVTSYGEGWLQVLEPRTNTSAFVRADLLQFAEPPSRYLYMEAPPLETDMEAIGIATTEAPLYMYPSPVPEAQATLLNASRRESIVGVVTGSDGEPWYQTLDGYFLPRDGLFLSSAPGEFGGRWLDVSLSGSARVVAYEGEVAVRSFHAIKGTPRFPTPAGAWSIVRRVANETMDSTTIGIPRFAPGGYFLKDVLYTQYFRETGESLHYNWWSSAWGAPGSHGCLGLSLADSRWLWEWASVGTPVLVHP
jgi:L,D-transpeptidase catalytic domain